MAETAPAKYQPLSGCAQWVLRLPIAEEAALSRAFAIELPAMNRATSMGDFSLLRLGPDEVWLDGPSGAVPPGLAMPHALVDISERQVRFLLDGPRVEDVLAAGSPLDLSLHAFPVGKATRTLFHKVEILLWRQSERQFRVECTRSFGPYLEEMLALAIVDCALEA